MKALNKTNILEINFDSLECKESLDSKLSIIQNKLHNFNNSYVGNKRRLLAKIIKAIDEAGIKYDSVLDLFCGSAFFSMAMKLLDKKVICNDILDFCYVNALTCVVNTKTSLTDEEKEYLINNKTQKKIPSYLLKYKDRFTENELKFIADFDYNRESLFSSFFSDGLTWMKSSLANASLFNYIMSHCFIGGRLNNGQILAKLEHRLKDFPNNKKEMSFKSIKWIEPIYPEDINRHKVFLEDAIDLLERKDELNIFPDLCYIDPPYGGQQSDYANMYDFFEKYLNNGIEYKNIEDIPVSFNKQTKETIRKEIEGKKRFINKKNYSKHFEKLINLTSYIPWIVISYNNSSWGSIEEIRKIVKKYRKNIIIKDFSFSYNYRNRRNRRGKEYLILAGK